MTTFPWVCFVHTISKRWTFLFSAIAHTLFPLIQPPHSTTIFEVFVSKFSAMGTLWREIHILTMYHPDSHAKTALCVRLVHHIVKAQKNSILSNTVLFYAYHFRTCSLVLLTKLLTVLSSLLQSREKNILYRLSEICAATRALNTLTRCCKVGETNRNSWILWNLERAERRIFYLNKSKKLILIEKNLAFSLLDKVIGDILASRSIQAL